MRNELHGIIASAGVERSEKIFNFLNFSIPLLMGIYVFANPLPLSALSNVCFYLSVLSLLILIGFRKTSFSLRSPLTLPFALFSFWAAIGLLFTLDFDNTLHDLRSHLLNYLVVFYLLVNYFNSQMRLEFLSVLVIFGATVSSLGTVISYYFIDGFPFSSRLGIGANFRDMPCIYIGFITIPAIVLAFNRLQYSKTLTNTLLSAFAIAVLVSTTLLTQSRGALFGLLAGLIILCFSNRKFLIVLISALILSLFVPGLVDRFDPEKMIHDERNKTNHLAMEVFKLHPTTGVGFGMQIYTNPSLVDLEKMNSQFPPEYRQEKVIAQPHNTIMDIVVRTGVVGLVLYSSILFASFLLLWKTYRTTKNQYYRSWVFCLAASYVSYLVPALFTDTTYGARAIIFYILLAMMTILWNLVRKEDTFEVNPS
ncbi:MAG: O-antigen ligase family protein [Sideroxyarcus sp.]|nr:O-antigen ligase family protein [Sideroxyarcus sp.]